MTYTSIADKQTIDTTAKALTANNFKTIVVGSADEAKEKSLELIPKGAEVFTMTSVTLDTTGIAEAINESGDYESVRRFMNSTDKKVEGRKMQQVGAAPEFAIGSVHAITEDGVIMIASNTGSQLPAYAYGADKVIFVVGAQKIVKNFDDGMKRIYEHVLPLESERARKAYGMERSNVSKMLILNKEVNPARITVILVGEALGY